MLCGSHCANKYVEENPSCFDSGMPKMTTLYFLSGECLANEGEGNDLIRGLTGRMGASGEGKTCELTLFKGLFKCVYVVDRSICDVKNTVHYWKQ